MSSLRMTCIVSRSRDRERHERDHPRPVDRHGNGPLMFGAVAGQTPRHQLAAVGDEVLEQRGVLVVDLDRLVRAELALLASADRALLVVAPPATTLAALAFAFTRLGCHGLTIPPSAARLVDAAEHGLFEVERTLVVVERRADLRLAGRDRFLVGPRRRGLGEGLLRELGDADRRI